MNDQETRELCLALLRADTEADVIKTLKDAGYWDDPKAWRLYGDRDGNYATIGNQQSRPEAALVEKIVNCVDARLMNECQRHGVDPKSDKAPASIRHAVSRYFEGRELQGEIGGTVQSWPLARQREQSKYITVAATGARTAPSIIIADSGEGQTPARMPETFLSIDRSNKLRIPFVQGKFNMGGTGVLKFCGQHSLQLIVTRRNPEIVKATGDTDPTSGRWGFTIVRRERPTQGTGAVRNSVFRYLAPLGINGLPEHGNVLSFTADELPLMPEANDAYARSIAYGSCIKLYEYDMKGFKSHVLFPNNLLTRLEVLLPEIALPVRIHECRDFKGHSGSYANTLVGLVARLAEDRGGNIETGYPASAPFKVHGQEMTAIIYAFKGDKAESYRTNEGIVFTINGQTHGFIPKTFFSRSAVKMGRLARSLLVVVECSKLTVDAREDLFMNSRDRLSGHELRKAIEEALEDLISKHPGLRELREKRRSEEIAERLENSKPLEDVLQSILKNSPTLERLFLLGQRLSRPHKSGSPGEREGGGQGGEDGTGEFHGKPHPTFLRFHKKKDGETLVRSAELGHRCRVKFDTDVVNDYFSRDANRGRYHVEVIDGAIAGHELDNTLTLHNGVANWSVSVPEDEVQVGDEIVLQCTVNDDTLSDPFVNIARLKIVSPSNNGGGDGGRDSRPGKGEKGAGGNGSGGTGGTQGNDGPPEPAGIQMPKIIKVREDDGPWKAHGFDENTACKIVEDAEVEGDEDKSVYTFYVNISNISLRTDMKHAPDDVSLREAKFIYGNVLIGLALIHQHKSRPKPVYENATENEEVTVESKVDLTTRALAPFLIPMIDSLGALTPDEAAGLAQVGDDE
jgi:hypothetical protein